MAVTSSLIARNPESRGTGWQPVPRRGNLAVSILLLLAIAITIALALAPTPARAAQSPGLPLAAIDAVWVQPLDGSAGFAAATIGLKWPCIGAVDLDSLPVLSTIKPQLLLGSNGGDGLPLGLAKINPGIAALVETEAGLRFKAGLVYLPVTRYRLGWFVGANLLNFPL